MIFHLSQDLMLVGKVSSAAKAAGVPYKSCPNADRLLESVAGQTSESPDSDRVLVDLQLKGLEIGDLIRRLREAAPQLQIITYAQHVKIELLDQARAANPDRVLTRGQFDQQVSQLVQGA